MSNDRKIDAKLQSMLLSLASETGSGAEAGREARELQLEMLRDGYRRIQSATPGSFRPGDLVRWQPRMKYTKWPQYGEAVVVVECLEPPVIEEDPCAGFPQFRIPLTLVLGMIHEEGFSCWHVDGRRFELAT